MGVRVLIAVHMALLVATSGVELELNKCCEVHQMLSADGVSCVEANWPDNFSFKINEYGSIIPPLDKEWVHLWLPPGLPMENISKVFTGMIISPYIKTVSSVNASSLLDPALLEDQDLSRNTAVFLEDGSLIARPRARGRNRLASYCVDAAAPPLGPFAMRFRTDCNKEECAKKCCWDGRLLSNITEHVECKFYREGKFWAPDKSSFTVFDTEFPYSSARSICENPRLLPLEERYAEWSRHTGGIHQFHFSTWETCFDFYRSSNGSLHEMLIVCEFSRITRGVYWLLRPLCFLSTLLLTVSLLSVACNKSMRRKIHGRCLACHAASLLAFNVGQTVYYIAVSDHMDEEVKDEIPAVLQTVCKSLALSMYFVLTASWFWLMALCANMARGFRLQMPRLNKESGKIFLVISAFAWGLPIVLTITCFVLFTQPKLRETPAWYTPSFMETRTCYIEPLFFRRGSTEVSFMKSGTALFYYGPVLCLVLSNIVCLVMTLRKVQYLKRGNSVLRREEDQIPLGQRHTEGKYPPTAYTVTGNEQTPQGRNRRGTTVDAKTVKLYIKMVLISGGIELLTEVIMWVITHKNFTYAFKYSENSYSQRDRDLAYRAAGYVTDFFRAAVVSWLAAPEGGYLDLIKGMLHRDKQKKSPGAGNAGRRKQNVA